MIMESKRFDVIFHTLELLGLIKNVYKAMESDDLADAVVVVINMLDKIGLMPPQRNIKSEERSDLFRIEGNQAYAAKKYPEAMELYNKALLFAPNRSRALKLAYSNRSALLYKAGHFLASLSDIETCLSMGCPDDIKEKLNYRKTQCLNRRWIEEEFGQAASFPNSLEKYLKLGKQCNPQIPCASTAVGVIKEAGIPKVVATKDIDVGTVVAVETSYVSDRYLDDFFTTCYYCNKITLNLIPCDLCCVALFCGEDCKIRCRREYHDVECQIVEGTLLLGDKRLALKATLKMKNSCQSWDEFVSASKKIGREKIRDSSVNEIYDRNCNFSLLNCDDEKFFMFGEMLNNILLVSDIIHQLCTICSFFPNDGIQRQLAISSFARIMMFLLIFNKPFIIAVAHENFQDKISGLHNNLSNFGFFSFLGKLNHSCNPNLLVVGLNKEIALIAVRPIKRGTELVVSKMIHWLDLELPSSKRQKGLLRCFNILCECQFCTGSKIASSNDELTNAQKQCIKEMDLQKIKIETNNPWTADKNFRDICKALALLSDVPNSKEYEEVFILFRRCVCHFQIYKTRNILLGSTKSKFSL